MTSSSATITMPRLSDSMEEGTVLEWLKAEGDTVAQGEELVEIETDKATSVYPSELAGTLRVLVGPGETVAVGEPIAEIGGPGGAHPDAEAAGSDGEAATAAEPATAPPAETSAVPAARPREARPAATPVARRMAGDHGIDLGGVPGSGRDGRISKADVTRFLERDGATAAPVATPAAGAKGEPTVETPSRTQAVIAQRMTEAKATVPEFSVEVDVDMSAAVDLRQRIGAASDARPPSLNDFVLRACAVTLRDHPRFNASYEDERVKLWPRINLGMAVAAEASLVVPTVFDADRKALAEIARETRELAAGVRAGTVSPAQLGGGTFTVSNLGGMGVPRFTAVINPPQAAILGVGAVVRSPIEVAGAAELRPMMSLSLTCDHRIVYGADAAAFMTDLRERLERPLLLAL